MYHWNAGPMHHQNSMFSVLDHFFGHRCFTELIKFLCGLKSWVQPLFSGYDRRFRTKKWSNFCWALSTQAVTIYSSHLYHHLRPLMANYVGDFTLQCPQIGELRVCSVIIFFFAPGEILESLRGAQPVHFFQIHSSKGEWISLISM